MGQGLFDVDGQEHRMRIAAFADSQRQVGGGRQHDFFTFGGNDAFVQHHEISTTSDAGVEQLRRSVHRLRNREMFPKPCLGIRYHPVIGRCTLMRTLCRRAGVTYFRFHALRHFGASVLDRANISLGSIQRILGHENRTTTEIYLHSIDEVDRAAMAYLGGEIEKKSHTDSHTEKIKGLR